MIYTVTGVISKQELGVTLSHEHIMCDDKDIEQMYFDKRYDGERTKLLYNKLLPVMQDLYAAGCRAVVEATPPDEGRNLLLMHELSKASGVNS